MKSFNIACLVRRFDGLGIGNCCRCLEHCSVRGVEFVVKKRVAFVITFLFFETLIMFVTDNI